MIHALPGLALGLVLWPVSPTPAEPRPPPRVAWVVAFVMSYDNNLESCGPTILSALERGVRGTDNTTVTVLSDDTDRSGLVRHVITGASHTRTTLDTDDIASGDVIASYLSWVAREHPSDRVAVVFLNHGGDLDAMCLDEWSDESDESRWLSARETGESMRAFRGQADGDVCLLFLQQCGRGSLDNLFNFHGAADAVLASQLSVGSPNTYYAASLKWLAAHPDASGAELAHQVMANDDHFTNYVCVDGKALADLPRALDPAVGGLLAAERPLRSPGAVRTCFGGWGTGETNYDALRWFRAAYTANGLDETPVADFEKWLRDDLIVGRRSRPGASAWVESLSGVALWVPSSRDVLLRYPDYPLHAASRLGALWDELHPPTR